MSIEYEYAFGQWVVTNAGTKYRYLGTDDEGDAIVYFPDVPDTVWMDHDNIRPDPDPPELVAGQLVMARDDEGDDWQGPHKYVGLDSAISYPHFLESKDKWDYEGQYKYAKPYIPAPETPESERPTTEQRLDSLEKRITELVTQIQTLKTNTKP